MNEVEQTEMYQCTTILDNSTYVWFKKTTNSSYKTAKRLFSL